MNKSQILDKIYDIEIQVALGNVNVACSKLRALYYRINNEGIELET